MGKQSTIYGTQNKSAFYPMRAKIPSVDQRKEAMDNNRRTNFISQQDGGFEAPAKKFDFATVPSKPNNDFSQVNNMIANLKKEHFKLGEQAHGGFMSRASSTIGQLKTQKPERPAWAHQKTNYELGGDVMPKTTDYQNRFAQTQTNFRSASMPPSHATSPAEERTRNKAKMTSDSIVIAGNNHFDANVSSRRQFTNTFSASKKMNTGLDALTTSYITGSHFKPGYGGFNGQSENVRAF